MLFGQVIRGESGQILDPILVRRELFKLYYETESFPLNQKADSSEALIAILKAIHVSSLPKRALKNYEDDADKECAPLCLSHENAWLNVKTMAKCKCTATKELQNFTVNNFVETVNSSQLMDSFAAAQER